MKDLQQSQLKVWGMSAHKVFDRSHLEILTPKPTFQRLPIALGQVKADNPSKNLLNQTCQTVSF